MQLIVTATSLNLRSKPLVHPSTRIAGLPQGQPVTRVGPSTKPGWIVIETTLGGATFRGHVSESFVAPAAIPSPGSPSSHSPSPGSPTPASPRGVLPPAVHLTPAKGKRSSKSALAFALSEAGMPSPRDASATPAVRVASLHANIAWLDSHASVRYQPGAGSTFCNIYAYDYAGLAGAYLPRVWWMGRALMDIAAGNVPPVQYGRTVHELSANSLYNWLSEWGDAFGWRRLSSTNEAQDAANTGQAVIACAQRKDLQRSGHITAVVPEPDAPGGMTAIRTNGVVAKPLLSQAGARNFRYEPNNFYLGSQFRVFGFWAHA